MRVVDVLVVGAGPAGTAAATRLAAAGREVVLVDKARFPRDKCCGDGLTTLALRELESLGLAPTSVASWSIVHEAQLHAPSGRRIRLPLPPGSGTYAAVSRRRDLDAALVELAQRAGAEVCQSVAATGASPHGGGVRVELGERGPVLARHVVAADGMWSPMRRFLGGDLASYRGDWHAFRQYFSGVGEQAQGTLHVLFEADLLPGYAWSFPFADGSANVGFGVLRGGQVSLGQLRTRWNELLARPRLAAILGPSAQPEDPVRAWPIPARLGAVPLRLGRVLFVGDAAAATDPLTGEGIGQALLTGRLAAEAILAGRPYEAAVHDALALDHRLAVGLGRVLGTTRRCDATLRLVDSHAWTRRSFARWMFEDYPRAVLAQPRHWRRGLLSRPGAYQRVSPPGRAAAG